MAQYNNILNALNNSGNGLTPAQKTDNYNTFSKLMEENVYLPDLIKKIDALEKRVEKMDTAKDNPLDAEIFAVMESTVRDDPAVAEAKRILQNNKTRIISEMCMRDEEYRRAYDEYRRRVNASYVARRETGAELRQEQAGQSASQESVAHV